MKRFMLVMMFVVGLVVMVGCTEADTAKHNLKDMADNFQIDRRIVVYHGITGEILQVTEGKCSIEDEGHQLEITCKVNDTGTDENDYIINYARLGDNTEYSVDQLSVARVSGYRYVRRIRPEGLIPDIVIDTSKGEID